MQRKIEELLLKEDSSNDLSGFYQNQSIIVSQLFYKKWAKVSNYFVQEYTTKCGSNV